MATKSITKNINITNKYLGRSLVVALENAQNKKAKDVQLQRTFSEIKGDKIRAIFGDNK